MEVEVHLLEQSSEAERTLKFPPHTCTRHPLILQDLRGTVAAHQLHLKWKNEMIIGGESRLIFFFFFFFFFFSTGGIGVGV